MTIINNSITPQFVTYHRSHFPNQEMLDSNYRTLEGAGCLTRIPKGLFVAFTATACVICVHLKYQFFYFFLQRRQYYYPRVFIYASCCD